MKYWPLSIIAQSPLMPPMFAWEFYRLNQVKSLTDACCMAVNQVTHDTPSVPVPNMAIIETVNGPPRRVFMDYPTEAEWFRLERGCFIADDEKIFLLVDVLH